MTVQPPPPPPPPAPSTGIPAWALYAGGAAIALVAAAFGFGWFGGDGDATAAPNGTGPLVTFPDDSSSTTGAPSTTAADSTTSSSTTSSTTTSTSTSTTTTTSSTTTTTSPYLLQEDFFDAQTESSPLFSSPYMDWEVADGEMVISAWFAGVVPAMYPNPFPDAAFEMFFIAEPENPNALFGMIVLGEDPSDGGIDEFLLVYVNPDADTVGAIAFRNGGFDQDQFVTIPVGAGWAPFQESSMRVEVSGSTADIYVNGQYALTWSGTLAPSPGWFGPTVWGGETGDPAGFLDFPDVLRVGLVRVEAL